VEDLEHLLVTPFHQKYVEVSGYWLSAKLPHHQCDLTTMVGGVIRQMLHELRQSDLSRAKWKELLKFFVCQPIQKLDLLFLDLRPLQLHRSDIWKFVWMEESVSPLLQLDHKI